MAEQRQDRRVRRSKAPAAAGPDPAAPGKAGGEITVRELTERADVNRGTFYSHYQNIYHMLEQVEKRALRRAGAAAGCLSAPPAPGTS